MTWYGIIAIITKLAELDEFTVESCARILECKFDRSTSGRFRSDSLQEPFEYAELIPGNENTILTLSFRVASARQEYAKRVSSMGRPIDIEIVSPPLADENAQKAKLGWDRKISLCYEFGDCRVWFGIEETKSQKRLIALSIHPPHQFISK